MQSSHKSDASVLVSKPEGLVPAGAPPGAREQRQASTPSAPPQNARSRRLGKLARQAVGVCVVIVAWEVVVRVGLVSSETMPDPIEVARALSNNAGDLVRASGKTIEDWLIGLLIGSACGVLLGLLVGLSTIAEAATDAIVRMMRPMPALALIPVAILVAGLGSTMTAGLVAFSTFWPVFINVRYGVRHIDPSVLEAGAALRLRGLSLLRHVIVPAATPYAAAGIQIAIGVGIVVTVSVQLVTANEGLGQLVLVAEQSGSTPLMYAGIFIGALLGWAVNTAFLGLRARVLAWHERGGNA